jgi:hypothetical protein
LEGKSRNKKNKILDPKLGGDEGKIPWPEFKKKEIFLPLKPEKERKG